MSKYTTAIASSDGRALTDNTGPQGLNDKRDLALASPDLEHTTIVTKNALPTPILLLHRDAKAVSMMIGAPYTEHTTRSIKGADH